MLVLSPGKVFMDGTVVFPSHSGFLRSDSAAQDLQPSRPFFRWPPVTEGNPRGPAHRGGTLWLLETLRKADSGGVSAAPVVQTGPASSALHSVETGLPPVFLIGLCFTMRRFVPKCHAVCYALLLKFHACQRARVPVCVWVSAREAPAVAVNTNEIIPQRKPKTLLVGISVHVILICSNPFRDNPNLSLSFPWWFPLCLASHSVSPLLFFLICPDVEHLGGICKR